MKITFIYKSSTGGERQEVTRRSAVPRKGDVVRITNFPEIEKEYIVTRVTWTMHEDESINPDVEATVSLYAINKQRDVWLGL